MDAGPALHVSANSLTGVYECEVTYYVKAAIIIPDMRPNMEQTYGVQAPKSLEVSVSPK